jgi:NTP pyrophosphatase (non-canonical NTP hydrolase)
MFNLVQFIKKQAGDLVDDHKKEKTASSAQGLSNTIKLPKLDVKPAPVSGKSAVHDATSTPSVGRNQSAPKPQRTQKITKIPRPLSKIAYKRNTGVVDADGLPYTNTDDVELLSKLGYSVDKDHYLFLPMGESKEDLYSYVEKCAGVPSVPSQAIDKGEAFSGEYLKDMGYEVPEGYEIKGDLVCPIEKSASTTSRRIADIIESGSPETQQKIKTQLTNYADKQPTWTAGEHTAKHPNLTQYSVDEALKGPRADPGYGQTPFTQKLQEVESIKAPAPKLLAQYKSNDPNLKDHFFTPHLAQTDPAVRKNMLANGEVYSARNSVWAKRPNYETVIGPDNIVDSSKRIKATQYYAPSAYGGIPATSLPSSSEGFMYKGAPTNNLQDIKNPKQPTFFSGIGEVSAGYAKPGDTHISNVRPVGWRDIRKEMGDQIRQNNAFHKTTGNQIGNYFNSPLQPQQPTQPVVNNTQQTKGYTAPKMTSYSNPLFRNENITKGFMPVEKPWTSEDWISGLKKQNSQLKPPQFNLNTLQNIVGVGNIAKDVYNKNYGQAAAGAGVMAAAPLLAKNPVTAKALPGLGVYSSGADTINKVKENDTTGAVMSGLNTVANAMTMFPATAPIGAVASVGLTGAGMLRDEYRNQMVPNPAYKQESSGAIRDDQPLYAPGTPRMLPRKNIAPQQQSTITPKSTNAQVKLGTADPAQTILITGHSGAGKTTLSRLLAEKLNLPVRRVDAHRGWDNYIRKDDKHWRKTLTPGTKENSFFDDLVLRATRDTLKNAPVSGIVEGTQLGHLSPEELAKFKAHIVVGGDLDQSIKQRIQRSVDKAAKNGLTFSPDEMALKKVKANMVANYWEPGVNKFRQMPGVLKYNHTEHKPEALIDQLKTLMNKKGEATHELKSSNIRAVGYSKESKKLDVAFHSGGNYTYNDVPKSLFDRIKRVKSPGKFFHKHIKRDNPYSYERMDKEADYQWYMSKHLNKRLTNGRGWPFSYLTGEAKELVDAVKNRDWENFKEEIGDTTFGAQMLLSQATRLNHPVYADLDKFWAREKVWKDMFKEKGSAYHPDHMQGGSNYAKPSKIIKAFASAGIKVDQREAERLANKHTGGKMEKEANVMMPRPGTVTNLEAYKEPLPSKMDMLGTILLGDAYIPTPRNQESMLEAKQRNRRNVDMGYLDTDTAKAIGEKISPFLGGNPVKARLDLERMQQDPNIMSQFKQANSILDKMQAKIYKQIEYAS